MTILQGLTTMVLTADDADAASRWYADILGTTPYYRSPQTGPCAYTEFRIGPDEDELGIMDRSFMTPSPTPTTTPITYWHTDDIHTTFTTLVAHGAHAHAPITERGGGFTTASIVDPFGNAVGIMHSPHWRARH